MKASGSISHLVATWRSYNHGVAETEVDLSGIVGAVAARVRAMTPEFDPDRFLDFVSTRSPVFKERPLPKSKKEAIAMMMENPNLIRRPIMIKGSKVIFGFDKDKYATL